MGTLLINAYNQRFKATLTVCLVRGRLSLLSSRKADFPNQTRFGLEINPTSGSLRFSARYFISMC